MEWLAGNPWVVWLVVAGLLALAETMTGDFTLLMLAGGALIGAGVAALIPGLLWLQVVLALTAAVALLLLLRPTLLERVRSLPGYRSSLDKMVGSAGTAISDVTASDGQIKVAGEVWSARAVEGTIAAGTEVEVYQIDGAVAVVYPRHQALP
jgi:membrane protein implicated in regulation of membrane protease activity